LPPRGATEGRFLTPFPDREVENRTRKWCKPEQVSFSALTPKAQRSGASESLSKSFDKRLAKAHSLMYNRKNKDG
jgi:hypothetical protein